jgi:beta-lactam-binding protein with PASTA domain
VDERTTAGAPIVEEEEYVPPRRPPLPELWPWLLLLLVLVVGGLLAAYFLTRDDNNKGKAASAVTVPGVVGLKQGEAVRRLNERGLAPQLKTLPSKFPRGTVFAQDPGEGTNVDRGSQVALSVSAATVVPVPNVVGQKTAAAVAKLKAVGLGAQVTTVSATTAAGTVLAENPQAGTRVGKGSTVALRVSKGQATVPDVRGQDVASAKAALTAAGLVPTVFQVPGVEPKGTVTGQNPLPNKKVARGSKVRINVSAGAGAGASGGTTTTQSTTTTTATQQVQVPNVVGLQQNVAQRRLNRAGFAVRVQYVASSKPSGQVVDQSPAAGTSMKKGSRVQITVSLGSNATTTQVPDVVGQDQQTATTTLQDAGFEVQVIDVPATDPSQNGNVVDEQPAGGSRAPQGSTVTIYVASGG